MSLMFLYPPGGEVIESVELEEGTITGIHLDREPYEISVAFRGSNYHLIFGSQCNGKFLCIPRLRVGAELATYQDIDWNADSLHRCGLAKDMALMFAQCLYEISDYLSY